MMMTITNVDKLMKFMRKENGGGDGGEGGAFTSADVGTPTYGSNRKKKKKRNRRLKKAYSHPYVPSGEGTSYEEKLTQRKRFPKDEVDRENAKIDETDRLISIREGGVDPEGMSEDDADAEYYARRRPLTEEEKKRADMHFDLSEVAFNLPEQYHDRIIGVSRPHPGNDNAAVYNIVLGGSEKGDVPLVLGFSQLIDKNGRPRFHMWHLDRINAPNINFGTGISPEEKWEMGLPGRGHVPLWEHIKQPGGLRSLKAAKTFMEDLSEANRDHPFTSVADSPRHANLYNKFFGGGAKIVPQQLEMPFPERGLLTRDNLGNALSAMGNMRRFEEDKPAVLMEAPSYNERNESSLNKLLKLLKGNEVMFTSVVDAEEAFDNPHSRLKDKTGVERADKFLHELSPEMKAMDEDDEKDRRHKLPNIGMGISSRDSSTIPTHSHATTFNKSFVIDLVKWVTQELRKESDPYANYRLPNEDPSRPYQEGEQAYGKGKKKTPTTEDTVPAIPNPNDGMRNMGTPGGMEDSKPGGAGTPGKFDPWAANDAKIPDAIAPTHGSKRKKGLEKIGVTVETPYQQGNNMQAMQKVSVGGGSPHILTMVQPRQGAEENPKFIEKPGEIDLNADTKENDIVNKNKERRKRDKEAEVSQEPPLAVAGAMLSQIDSPIQNMQKTEFGINPDDALHRGGDKDIIEDEDSESIPEDEDEIIHDREVEKDIRKILQKNMTAWFARTTE